MTSEIARAAGHAPNTDQVWVVLLTLDHPDMPEDVRPFRFAQASDDLISRGMRFLPYPFAFGLPASDGETLPQSRLTIDNVDRRLITTARSLQGPVAVTIEVVLASQPDVVEQRWDGMRIVRLETDRMQITGSLSYEDVLSAAWPVGEFTPTEFPGLF
ncbi:DUF1833 family protein [Tistrella bauzanensis]|uniref:DUF1833 family protein n=1 Tax=Tistrella TaxID=171436 RepID=UPI0031F6F894